MFDFNNCHKMETVKDTNLPSSTKLFEIKNSTMLPQGARLSLFIKKLNYESP